MFALFAFTLPTALIKKEQKHPDNKYAYTISWDFRRQLLCWIDINGAKFWTFDPISNESASFDLPERPGSFALCDSDKFDVDTYFIAFETGPAFYNLSSSKIIGEKVFEFEPNISSRTNDGRVDKQGRFVFGGMSLFPDITDPQFDSRVYRINTDLSHHLLLPDTVACTNSLCFSKNGRNMYFTDTHSKNEHAQPVIYKYDYFADDRLPTNRRQFAALDTPKPGEHAFVDGSIVDNTDGVWNSVCGASRVYRFDANGVIDTVVHVPEPWVSCAAFGGSELDTLFITTIKMEPDFPFLKGNERGALYSVKLPFTGCKEDVFLGS